ncbi:brain mitochondrial carrier 1 isoform X4 [Brachionus plicatilis]|uniref:Brain mitochondrial carrier 1 isoform X4 n=1 Tax=Brachionus plicatilis TaxID=10195 RepID=A0A3M7Q3T4_BRAPC|nr:brain mitochondrial carrier 1 isoform X4 [Brachionus plicatilis]
MVYKNFEPFLIGGLSSCNAEFFTFPIDLVKTRLQIQGQAINNCSGKYRGMLDCFSSVYREEGIKTMFSGIKPALLRQATYGTFKLGFYQYMKKMLFSSDVSHHNEHFYKNIFIGSLSGASANALANPTDVLKIRMQADYQLFKNQSMTVSFRKIFNSEGLFGLYRGVWPNAQRAAIITGVELSIYDSVKQFLIYKLSLKDGIEAHLMSSAMAGFCAAVAATPIDVIKVV